MSFKSVSAGFLILLVDNSLVSINRLIFISVSYLMDFSKYLAQLWRSFKLSYTIINKPIQVWCDKVQKEKI